LKPLVIATRRSALALWQAHHVGRLLSGLSGRPYELLEVVTKGDKILDVPLARVGGKGLFVKEIEDALLDGRADLAVHSLKDVPTVLPPGLVLGAIPEREDPRDAVCSPRYGTLAGIPAGGTVGTSSLRRQCQLRAARPDLQVVSIRGNVATRLAKADGELDAVVLAYAGLKRLGLGDRATEVLPVDRSLPAIGQGALAVEIREGDPEIGPLVARIEHRDTRVAVAAERALLARLEGGCQVPIAAHARVAGDRVAFDALVGRPDGTVLHRVHRDGGADEAAALGVSAAEELLALGADRILAELQGAVVGRPH
jgi:hydroxymethylbilane synthase